MPHSCFRRTCQLELSSRTAKRCPEYYSKRMFKKIVALPDRCTGTD